MFFGGLPDVEAIVSLLPPVAGCSIKNGRFCPRLDTDVLILVFSEGAAACAGVRNHIMKGVNSLFLWLLPSSSPVVST